MFIFCCPRLSIQEWKMQHTCNLSLDNTLYWELNGKNFVDEIALSSAIGLENKNIQNKFIWNFFKDFFQFQRIGNHIKKYFSLHGVSEYNKNFKCCKLNGATILQCLHSKSKKIPKTYRFFANKSKFSKTNADA